MLKNLSLTNSKKIKRKGYREAYVRANLVNAITQQITINRKERGWSQRELAEKIGSKQSAISRLEDPSYGKFSIQALLDIASAFDVALQVRFLPFSRLIGETNQWSQSKASVMSFDDDVKRITEHQSGSIAPIKVQKSTQSTQIYTVATEFTANQSYMGSRNNT